MKVKHSKMSKMVLTELDGLDPITVLIDEYSHGEAKVIVDIYGESWSSYWGSMGGDVKEFFTRTNVGYLVNCFDRGIRPSTSELDIGSMSEGLTLTVKKKILEERKNCWICKEDAKWLWDNVGSFLEDLKYPQHPYDNYEQSVYSEDERWFRLFGLDADDLNIWFWENVVEVYEENHQYTYLEKIITAVREAVINNYEGGA